MFKSILSAHSHLQSVQGGLATKQEIVDLSKFLYMVNGEVCDLRHVSYMANVVAYLNRLRKSRVGPYGQVTKLTTLNNALTMMVSKVPEDGGSKEEQKLVVRAKVVETKIRGLQKSLRKECAGIRMRKRDLFQQDKGGREAVLGFLESKQLQGLVKSYVTKEKLTESEYLLTRQFFMSSLLYKNAQRQGPVVNLRVDEQARATAHSTGGGESIYIYKVWEHKTSGQFGSANLVVPEELHQLISAKHLKHKKIASSTCFSHQTARRWDTCLRS